jgi:hypothetical protein
MALSSQPVSRRLRAAGADDVALRGLCAALLLVIVLRGGRERNGLHIKRAGR